MPDFSVVVGMAKDWRRIDEVRALILAENIRKNYLEELLENDHLHTIETSPKRRQRKPNSVYPK